MIFKKNNSTKKAEKIPGRPLWVKTTGWVVAAVFLFLTMIGWYWSRTPDVFWVNQKTDGDKTVIGYAATDTLVRVAETLLEKPGGYLSNDVMLPGVFLDNIPPIGNSVSCSKSAIWRASFEMTTAGASRNPRKMSMLLSGNRSSFSTTIRGFFRVRNLNIGMRLPDSPNTVTDWPVSVNRKRNSMRELTTFVSGSPRSRNGWAWLAQVEKRLGSLSRRLGDSVAASVINTDLAGDSAAEANTSLGDSVDVRTSWFEIDDIFYEARGTAWALIHFFRAAEFDFAQVLADKNEITDCVEWRRFRPFCQSFAGAGELPGQGQCGRDQPEGAVGPGVIDRFK
jgi:hypothetical protein